MVNDSLKIVVGIACNFRGLQVSRVIKAHTFPKISSGNIKVASIMLDKETADLIAADT